MTDISQAACKHKNAIFGPTPGSEQSSSTVFGTSESKSSRRRRAACLIYLSRFFLPCWSATRGGQGTENELRLAAPEAHLVDGIRDNVLLGSQQSIKAERSVEWRRQEADAHTARWRRRRRGGLRRRRLLAQCGEREAQEQNAREVERRSAHHR